MSAKALRILSAVLFVVSQVLLVLGLRNKAAPGGGMSFMAAAAACLLLCAVLGILALKAGKR